MLRISKAFFLIHFLTSVPTVFTTKHHAKNKFFKAGTYLSAKTCFFAAASHTFRS